MINFPSYETQLQLINKLKNQLDNEYVTLDDLTEIKEYLPKTTLNLGFVVDYLKHALDKSRSTFGLKQKIHQIKLDFIEHLDKRIYFLTHLREAFSKPLTPWLASLKQDASINEGLIKAHLHIQDILFTSQEVLEFFPDQIESFIKREFIPFQRQYLSCYMQMLTLLPEDSKKNICQAFNALQNSLFNKDLKQVQSQIEKITKDLSIKPTLFIW